MTWVIIGLISFIIQIYVLKHTYSVRVKGDLCPNWEKAKKINTPSWTILIMLIASSIPVVNIVEVIVFWVTWLKCYASPDEYYSNTWYTYWRFKDKFFSRKI